MAEARRAGAPVIAVDLPSGVSSDTGSLPGPVAGADLTVTFAALKRGHVLPPACNVVGEVVVADIGIAIDAAGAGLIEATDVASALGTRAPGAHKGDFGHVLVIAGSLGKSGAAVLAGMGALRAGAGLVTVATPAGVHASVAAARPELMTEPLPEFAGGLAADALDAALALAGTRDVVVLGPGLGQSEQTVRFAREFARRCATPLVVDADGLNALAGERAILAERSAPTLLTPHPGEAARLLGTNAAEIQMDRVLAASTLARECVATVALKGQRTLVVDPAGHVAVNPTGNPGMASAGTGDVLAGILGALLARGLSPRNAAAVAVYLHGAAGDAAAARLGQESLIAGDLLDHLGEAILGATVA
jgi:NAD(P)H-hydrate epimerase